MLTFGELFAGIGGMGRGLEMAGMRCVWQVERDEFCRRVLAKHWPDVRRHEDVCTYPPDDSWEVPDLICGGFPCQPVSVAGKQRRQADDRWLWPEFARIIRTLRPRYALMENVPGLLVGGMGDVLGDLAEAGYDAEWLCLRASDVGAPHRRERVFIVAHAAGERLERPEWEPEQHPERSSEELADAERGGREAGHGTQGGESVVADGSESLEYAALEGLEGAGQGLSAERRGDVADAASVDGGRGSTHAGRGSEGRTAARWPSPPGHEQHGWEPPRVLRFERGVGSDSDGSSRRLARWNRAALKALGNCVVPQVAEVIGRMIVQAHGED